MLTVFSVPSALHTFPDHPEIPERVTATLAAIEASPLARHLVRAVAQPASVEQITRVHTPAYVAELARAMAEAPGYIDPAPTYITPQSFECARLAAGAAIGAVDSVIESASHPLPPAPQPPSAHAALALIRPPGHHAMPGHAMGFCLFNNVAIAARHARAQGAAKVMIVDIDVHHGNGTQATFYEDPSVLFLSTHQGGLYPDSGWELEIGRGAGQGYTINVPLPRGAGDEAYKRICANIIIPAAERFTPALILVSAGFDAHWRDPIGALQLSARGYGQIIQTLRALALKHCEGKIALVLEGGYDLAALPACVVASLHALLGDEVLPDPIGPAPYPEPDIRPLLARLRTLHQL